MRAHAFARHATPPRGELRSTAVSVRDDLRASGGSALRTDEVSRHAVRLVVIGSGAPQLEPFGALPQLLRAGDLVVVNDAATLPASFRGHTSPSGQEAGGPGSVTRGSGEPFELRLSGPVDGSRLYGVLFGPGDHTTRTEHRAPPPAVAIGDRVRIGELEAIVATVTGRRVQLIARAHGDALWQALYAAGTPVQYAHRVERMPLWSVQTAYAARPWAAEMPSAGRPLTWDVLFGLKRAGVGIATLTHAAGLSSTGDDALDRALPWPERYEIPRATAAAVAQTREQGGRVIAIGTTVVRALESAGASGRVEAGSGTATLRIDAQYKPRITSGLVSGLHVPGESHFELLSAFARVDQLRAGLALAAQHGLSSHELGDACLIAPN
jgi:S-adenosylmethionine:tRNA ribosyltransferase-isomerase